MKIRWNKTVLALGVLVSIASVIGAVAYTETLKQNPKQKFYQPDAATEAPPVKSKVKGLEITGVSLVNQGTPQAAITIDVTNNRDSAVMSVDFVSGENLYSALGIDGLLEEGAPQIIIPPHTLKSFRWSLGEIMKGQTVFLASAIFADGKEEGDKRSLNGIKIHRRNFQQKQREAKTKNGGPQ